MNSWSFDRYAVLGLGRTGRAAIAALHDAGKSIIATDQNADFSADEFPDGVSLRVGDLNILGAEACVVSPGFSPSSLAEFGFVPLLSEIDLAYEGGIGPMISVTGTDGKTTTTELIAHILKSTGHVTIAAGNIGIPLLELLQPQHPDFDVVVAEISAFQMWSANTFRAEISVFTNVAEDHVDYFDSFEEYVDAKRRLIAHCEPTDTAVFNADDVRVQAFDSEFPGEARYYGTTKPQKNGEAMMWLENETLVFNGEAFIGLGDIPLVGIHNAMNVMAATLATEAWGVRLRDISAAVKTFKAAPHRCQPLGVVDGNAVYDDSKATNAHASMAGLRDLPTGLVAIVGGVDKGLDLEPWTQLLKEKARHVIVIGEIAERLSATFVEHGLTHFSTSPSLDDAVTQAFEHAVAGSAIVLSPGCSSFDMFESYADRGRQFQAAIDARR